MLCKSDFIKSNTYEIPLNNNTMVTYKKDLLLFINTVQSKCILVYFAWSHLLIFHRGLNMSSKSCI